MGMRLYPNTQRVESVEKLAGVPAGTMERLDALRKQYGVDDESLGFFERENAYGRFFDAKERDANVNVLDHFVLFGWGKVYSPEHQNEWGGGRIDDIATVAALFKDEGIEADPALTEGVHWS
jgi:hypothetical protein